MEHYATFDAGGLLHDSGNHIQIMYSRSLLDAAGISSISASAATISKVRDVIVREGYEAARQGDQHGARLWITDGRQNVRVDLAHVDMVQLAVSRDEFNAIKQSLVDNGLIYVDILGNTEYLLTSEGGRLVGLGRPYPENDLSSVPLDWNRLDASARAVGSGAEPLLQGIKWGTMLLNSSQFTVTAPNAVYRALGLNESNNWGYNGARGKLHIVFQ